MREKCYPVFFQRHTVFSVLSCKLCPGRTQQVTVLYLTGFNLHPWSLGRHKWFCCHPKEECSTAQNKFNCRNIDRCKQIQDTPPPSMCMCGPCINLNLLDMRRPPQSTVPEDLFIWSKLLLPAQAVSHQRASARKRALLKEHTGRGITFSAPKVVFRPTEVQTSTISHIYLHMCSCDLL